MYVFFIFSEIIKPEEFQQLYVQLCLRCLEKDKYDDEPTPVDNGGTNYGSNPDLLHEIFRGADAVLRRISSLTEMQLRFSEEVDDFICGVKNFQDAFFLDSNFEEQDMINLATICDLNYDKDNPTNTINDIS